MMPCVKRKLGAEGTAGHQPAWRVWESVVRGGVSRGQLMKDLLY